MPPSQPSSCSAVDGDVAGQHNGGSIGANRNPPRGHAISVNEQETKLIERCRAGEVSAYEELYRAHAGRVAAFFLRSGFAPADSDDLVQDTFIRAFRSLATFDPDKGSFRVWVAQIARNLARNQWARRKEPDAFDPELAQETLSAPDDPSHTPEAREDSAAVNDCVSRLPADLGRIVEMRYVDGRTLRGVAECLDMPEATVRLRMKEAMGRLETCLKAKGVLE